MTNPTRNVATVAVLFVMGASAVGGQTSIPPNLPEAKAVALRAVVCMLLVPDLEQFGELVAEQVAIDGDGPRAKGPFVDGLKKGFTEAPPLAEWLSVREILFFGKDDTVSLSKRFPAKRDFWSPKQVPAYIDGGLGCYVVAKELREGREVDDEVYILIVKKVRGRYRVVYFGNS